MSTDSSLVFLTDSAENRIIHLDYATLRQEGIRQLERLADSEWTDFNEHDPGITILEQLCYALSDLAYRIDFSLPDLLSEGGANPYSSLHAPALILSSRPVTLMDMRKLVIDVDGVKNAWIETVNESEPVIYFQKQGLPRTDQPANLDDTENLIHFANSGNERTKIIKTDGGVAVQPKGLFRVLIEKYPAANNVVEDVTARLHAHRSLAMDFQSIKVLEPQLVVIKASIEITPQGNPDDIYLAILKKITDYFSPTVTFYSLAERLADNQTMEEIFDSPRLNHGFIDTEQLAKMQRKTSLRSSDLIHAIMDVEGVRLVKYLVFMNQGKEIPWVLELEPDKVPKLDTTNSMLTLVRNQLSIGIDNKALNVRFDKSQSVQARKELLSNLLEPLLPSGRDRQVKKYYSIQHHYPANYGIGAIGLPATADKKRQAQAQQLKAYLLFFDQLLTNSFAQLSHVGDLFGFDDSQLSTYFAGSFDDSSLGLDKLWVKEFKEQLDGNEYLEKLVISSPTDDLPRKHRFLDHLLARFAEPFTDYSRFQKNELSPLAKLAQDKAAILHHYPEFSGGRGTGFNVTQAWDKNNRAGLEQRLRLKLGFSESEQLYLIEHILLRPIESDSNQIAPLLANARFDDPYSLQITLVFAGNSSRFKEEETDFRNFVEQLVREETPAHLIVYVRWLVNDSAIENFSQAYENWQILQSNFRNHLDQQDLQLKFRDARDRVIDLLEIGQTYPLADIKIDDLTVAYGERAAIFISFSQKNVSYQLYDKDKNPITPEIAGTGNGEELTLTTNESIVDNRTFTIQATKSHPKKNLSVILIHPVTVKVGLNTKLVAKLIINEIELDTALVDYDVEVQVKIKSSQQGVEYSLFDAHNGNTLSETNVKGTLGDILLSIKKVTEDTQIKIRANNLNKADDTVELEAVLNLNVRANPALTYTVTPSTLDFGTGAVVVVKDSQASASYQILTRPIHDSEFIRVFAPDKADWTLDFEAMSSYWVEHPPTDLNSLGDSKTGNGSDLSLIINNLTEDSLIVIRTTKTDNKSSIPLTQVAAIPVRPGDNSSYPLHLSAKGVAVSANGFHKGDVYSVTNGQPGVYYYFRLAGSTEDLGLPVYFHKAGKGIDQLRVEIDFVITGGLPTPPPEWECPMDLDTTVSLSIRAVKAQTDLEVSSHCSVADLLK